MLFLECTPRKAENEAHVAKNMRLEIAEKPYVVAYNKWSSRMLMRSGQCFRKLFVPRELNLFVREQYKETAHEVISSVYELLKKHRAANAEPKALYDQASENLDHVAKKIDKERGAAINEFDGLSATLI